MHLKKAKTKRLVREPTIQTLLSSGKQTVRQEAYQTVDKPVCF